MRRFLCVWSAVGLVAGLCWFPQGLLFAQAQNPETKEAPVGESKGMPPRATPGDYQAQAKAGSVTIAAEFAGHSVPKPEGPLSTDDFVVVEAGFFGASGERVKLSIEDFTLRINGKKSPLPSQPYGMVARSLRDPEYVAPEEVENKKAKGGGGGISTGGKDASATPLIVHIPLAMQRSMTQYIQKSSLPEGDRSLPVAGLLFFRYGGKAQGIHSLELSYTGPAGTATLTLQP